MVSCGIDTIDHLRARSVSLGKELAVLAVHCAVWFLLYVCMSVGFRNVRACCRRQH